MSVPTIVADERELTVPAVRWPSLILALAVAAALFWLVAMELGPASHAVGQTGSFFHEVFHDGRHLLGVPCH